MTTIRYDFVAAGGEDVERAFDNIDKRAALSAKANETAQRKITASVRANAIARERIEKAPVNRTAQLARQVERDQERAASRTTQRHRMLLRSQISAGEQAGRAQARQNDAMRRLRERHDAAEAKAHERRIAIAKRAGERQGRESGAAMAKALSSTQGASFGGILKEMFSPNALRGAIGKLGSIAKGIGLSALGTGAALFTGVTTAGAKDAMRTQEIANRVSINARMAGKEAVDPSVLRKEFEAAAIANPGQKASEIGEAIQAFVTKTGDLATARKSASVFATVASATGGNVVDIAGAAADISQKMNITKMSDMQEALASLTFQGKQGAFELSDAARLFPRLLAAGSALGVKQDVSGLRQIGGFAQIARTSTGGGEQATTAIENVFNTLKAKSKELEREGVKVYEGKGKDRRMRSFVDIIADAVGVVGGTDIKAKNEKLTKIMGEQGIKAINPLITTGMKAMNATPGTDQQRRAAAVGAVQTQFSQAINAPGDWAELQKDAAQAQQDTSAKLTAAWEKITATVGEKLLPVIAEFAERIADTPELIDAFKAALETIIQMMKDLGLLKEKTPAQIAEAEKARGGKLEKKRTELLESMGTLASPEERANQVAELARTTVEQADAQKKQARAEAIAQAQKDIQTPEALAERMISIGQVGKTPEEEARRRSAIETQARLVFAAPGAYKSDEQMDLGAGGKESEQQMALRRAIAQAQDAKQSTSTASGVSGEGLGAAAKALMDAAAALKSNAGNQPTTVAATP